MKTKFLSIKLPAICIGLVLSSFLSTASAVTIAATDWHLTTGPLGGLRQSTTNSSYYFATSKTTTWDPAATYLAPTGYSVATTAQGNAVFIGAAIPTGIYTHYNQGGWSGYKYGGLTRIYFRFSDSGTTDAYKHPGFSDEALPNYSPNTNPFAGLVLIKNSNVPDTGSTLALLGLGLLGLVGMRRRFAK